MCRMQDQGLYLKGEGQNHRSKVEKCDIKDHQNNRRSKI